MRDQGPAVVPITDVSCQLGDEDDEQDPFAEASYIELSREHLSDLKLRSMKALPRKISSLICKETNMLVYAIT